MYEASLRAECPECYDGKVSLRKGIGNRIVLSCPYCLKYEEIIELGDEA